MTDRYVVVVHNDIVELKEVDREGFDAFNPKDMNGCPVYFFRKEYGIDVWPKPFHVFKVYKLVEQPV